MDPFHRGQLLGLDEADPHRDHRQHDPQRGQQAPRPAQPEPPEPDPSRAFPLRQQQVRDQVTGENEEDTDAEQAALRPAEVQVVRDDGEHGERAQAIEARHVPCITVNRVGHGGSAYAIP